MVAKTRESTGQTTGLEGKSRELGRKAVGDWGVVAL